MKKLFLTLAALAVAPAAFAQVEIGLKVSPSVSFLRASSPATTSFQGDGSKFSFGGGVFVDYFFGENYAFNTGLFLTGKGGTISYQDGANKVIRRPRPCFSSTRELFRKSPFNTSKFLLLSSFSPTRFRPLPASIFRWAAR